MFSLRDEAPDDLLAIVELHNRANPWDPPETLERARHRQASRDPSLPQRRLVAEEGSVVVAAGVAGPVWWFPRHIIRIGIDVELAWQRRGIGSAILGRLLPFAREHGTDLLAMVSEQAASGIAFARHHGLGERYRMFEMQLDVKGFDPTPYERLPGNCATRACV